jgi:ribonuclease HI
MIDFLPEVEHTPESIDRLAAELSTLLSDALNLHGKPCTGFGPQHKPWWNAACQAAHDAARKRRLRNLPARAERQAFQDTVHRAVTDYWRDYMDRIETQLDMHKAVGWHKRGDGFEAPPITHDGRTWYEDRDKAAALRAAKLERPPTVADIDDPWSPPLPDRPCINQSPRVLRDEARRATIGVKATAPGGDNINVATLKLLWPTLEGIVTKLFDACVQTGHHPEIFRRADIIMIEKRGKPLDTPAGWRPISLLNTLGKGLERLMSWRLSRSALIAGLLNDQQFGALPGRSATDLVSCLIHDIEIAMARGQVCVFVANDVKGAFDGVLHGRMVLRMREQGWSENYIRWAESFVTRRTARVKFGQFCPAEYTPLGSVGVPQGSPASPILYLLYTAPLHLLSSWHRRFGYADDSGVLGVGKSVEEATANATRLVEEQLVWGRDNGVEFDLAKAEAQLFSRAKVPEFPTIEIPEFNYSVQVAHEVDATGHLVSIAMRWLGVWLDRMLTFRTHIEKWAAKGRKVARAMKMLASVSHGPRAEPLRHAALAAIPSVTHFACEVYWEMGGRSTTWAKHKLNRQGLAPSAVGTPAKVTMTKVVTPIFRDMLRTVLPVFRTTSLPALCVEAGIPPPSILADVICRRAAVRIQSLDKLHPIVRRITLVHGGTQRRTTKVLRQTRLQRLARVVDSCARPDLLHKRWTDRACTDDPPFPLAPKEEAAALFNEWMAAVPRDHTVIFSDGSMGEDADTIGWGFSIWRGGMEIASGHGRHRDGEVFDAEAKGAVEGLNTALRLPDTRDVTACIDNQAVIWCLSRNPSRTSFHEFRRWHDMADQHGDKVNIRWSPGHMDIEGNDQADALAKLGLKDPQHDSTQTLARVRRSARQASRVQFESWWDHHQPARYKHMLWAEQPPSQEPNAPEELPTVTATLKCPESLKLPRQTLARWLMMRSGHGPYAAYHDLRKHPDAPRECSCGRPRTPEHIVHCVKMRRKKSLWEDAPTRTPVDWFMVLVQDGERFARLDRESGFHTHICPITPTWRATKQKVIERPEKVRRTSNGANQVGRQVGASSGAR